MRTPTPTMEAHGDTPEVAGLPSSPKPGHVNSDDSDVTNDPKDVKEDENDVKDETGDVKNEVVTENSGAGKKRHRRESDTTTTSTSTKTVKTTRDTSTGISQLLRMQKLAHQNHLMEVVHSGDVSELKRFLEQKEGKLDLNFFDKEGQTALHHSCGEGNFELVKLLIKFGADTRLANRDGWNPLHIATFGGHHDIMLYLIGGPTR